MMSSPETSIPPNDFLGAAGFRGGFLDPHLQVSVFTDLL